MKGILEKGNKEGEKRKIKGWFDEECREEKRMLKKQMRRWRREGGSGGEYKEGKKRYRELCKRKKEEENKKWIRKAKEARTEGQVWVIVRRERGRRRRIAGEGIGMED